MLLLLLTAAPAVTAAARPPWLRCWDPACRSQWRSPDPVVDLEPEATLSPTTSTPRCSPRWPFRPTSNRPALLRGAPTAVQAPAVRTGNQEVERLGHLLVTVRFIRAHSSQFSGEPSLSYLTAFHSWG